MLDSGGFTWGAPGVSRTRSGSSQSSLSKALSKSLLVSTVPHRSASSLEVSSRWLALASSASDTANKGTSVRVGPRLSSESCSWMQGMTVRVRDVLLLFKEHEIVFCKLTTTSFVSACSKYSCTIGATVFSKSLSSSGRTNVSYTQSSCQSITSVTDIWQTFRVDSGSSQEKTLLFQSWQLYLSIIVVGILLIHVLRFVNLTRSAPHTFTSSPTCRQRSERQSSTSENYRQCHGGEARLASCFIDLQPQMTTVLSSQPCSFGKSSDSKHLGVESNKYIFFLVFSYQMCCLYTCRGDGSVTQTVEGLGSVTDCRRFKKPKTKQIMSRAPKPPSAQPTPPKCGKQHFTTITHPGHTNWSQWNVTSLWPWCESSFISDSVLRMCKSITFAF